MLNRPTNDTPPKLPASVLGALYQHCLVRLPAPPADIERPTPAKATPNEAVAPLQVAHTLGDNQQGIILAVDYANAATILESDLTFLLNILNACRLGLRDVLITNLHGMTASERQRLIKTYQAATLIMFGLNPADMNLPIRFPEYQRQSFDGIQYLSAPALSRLEQDPAGKKQLWGCLKSMFLT